MSRPQRQLRATRLLRPHLLLPQRLRTPTPPRRLQSLPLAQNTHREAGPIAARATCSGRRSRAAVVVVSAVAVAVAVSVVFASRFGSRRHPERGAADFAASTRDLSSISPPDRAQYSKEAPPLHSG